MIPWKFAKNCVSMFGISQKGSPERCRFRFFPSFFFSVFFRFHGVFLFPFFWGGGRGGFVFFLFSSVFFLFLPFHLQKRKTKKRNGEVLFARPLLRNPDVFL